MYKSRNTWVRNCFANKVVSFESLNCCWFEFYVLFCILCLMLWDDQGLEEALNTGLLKNYVTLKDGNCRSLWPLAC